MSAQVCLAVAQFSSAIGKHAENIDAVERLATKAANDAAQFVLFPEDCLTGYPAAANSAFDVALNASDERFDKLLKLAKQSSIILAAGFIERNGEHCHSAHFIARPDGTHQIIRKYSVDDRDQRIGITPAAPQNDGLTIAGVKTAMAICMDGTDAFFESAHRNGAKIILHPSGGACMKSAHASDVDADKIDAREREGCNKCVEAARERAKKLSAVYLVSNPVGFDGERGYPGNSFIISADGQVLVHLAGTAIIENMKEAVAVAKVVMRHAAAERSGTPRSAAAGS